MRWQRGAQAAIALFVIGFVAILVISLTRQGGRPPQQLPPERSAPGAPLETRGGGVHEVTDPSGRGLWSIKFGTHVSRADGRNELAGGIEATINRGTRQYVITAREADILPAPGGVKDAIFRGDVRLVDNAGLQITTAEATYTQDDGMITIPGVVAFVKGRTAGSGASATYDQNREVFWIRDKARVSVAPDAAGSGGIEATARAIGMARAEHYIQLQDGARISGDGRLAEANDITIRLTDDDERVRALELRGNSRMTGSGGPQAMTARDIDLAYGEDGRTLQQARLVENAVLQLAGAGAGKRIAGSVIDLQFGPDGAEVTHLSATSPVQVDLPAEGSGAAKRIRSATLIAAGQPGSGLRNATFGGGVEYRETRAARGRVPALDRTARSQTLLIDTAPGLGTIEKADFRGSVRFTDGPAFVAEGQQGIYHLADDRLELMPAAGQPGPASPSVTDGKVSVAARTIQFSLATREMTAETTVRSTIQPAKNGTGRGSAQGRLPSMLAQDEPVNVTANRLAYKGAASSAVYTGNVTLWQGVDTRIRAAAITIDDTKGDLTATGGVTTEFMFEEADRKTGAPRRERTTGTADTFRYDDAKRLATYTGNANLKGLQGDVTGEKIELFLKADGNELDRAEAYGANGQVQVREGHRLAKGSHLTYTAADDQYLMTGTPVEIIQEKDGTCTRTVGFTATFNRTTEGASVQGDDNITMQTATLKACPAGLIR